MFKYDVCVIGCGRVGLPLLLSFHEQGLKVCGIDRDIELVTSVRQDKMPFEEPGYDELVKSDIKLAVAQYEGYGLVAESKTVIITVGTPLLPNVEPDRRQITSVLESIKEHLGTGQHIVLRSTVAPGTTNYLINWLISRDIAVNIGNAGEYPYKHVFVTFCPERIVEGKSHEELLSLPQIVGIDPSGPNTTLGYDDAYAHAEWLFNHFGVEVLRTTIANAELIKLFNNIYRYVNFALANHFMYVASDHGANAFDVIRLANHNYERSNIPSPGFTAGTCLRKDFGMISAQSPYPDIFSAAWHINEYTPQFVVNELDKHVPMCRTFSASKVAMLGYSFKANTDDIRDSLASKLYRVLQFKNPNELKVSDYNLGREIGDTINGNIVNYRLDEIKNADIFVVGTNHDRFKEFLRTEANPDALVADVWNVTGLNKLVFSVKELR